jgi:hypothetical protein
MKAGKPVVPGVCESFSAIGLASTMEYPQAFLGMLFDAQKSDRQSRIDILCGLQNTCDSGNKTLEPFDEIRAATL